MVKCSSFGSNLYIYILWNWIKWVELCLITAFLIQFVSLVIFVMETDQNDECYDRKKNTVTVIPFLFWRFFDSIINWFCFHWLQFIFYKRIEYLNVISELSSCRFLLGIEFRIHVWHITQYHVLSTINCAPSSHKFCFDILSIFRFVSINKYVPYQTFCCCCKRWTMTITSALFFQCRTR